MPPPNPLNPVVAFIIGLSIILLASILNAAGLNLTKLDHVRTSAVPKSDRQKDWMRPLWLLGMFLYMFVSFISIYLYSLILFTRLSQIIGSTLALEYMRAGMFFLLSSPSFVTSTLQNTLLLLALLLSSSTSSSLASSLEHPSQVLTSMYALCLAFFAITPSISSLGYHRRHPRCHRHRCIWFYQQRHQLQDRRRAPNIPVAPWWLARFLLRNGLCTYFCIYLHKPA